MNTLEAKGRIDYNFKEDSLYFYIEKMLSKGEHNYSDSVDLKGFILDLDKHRHIIGLELLGASEKLNVDKMVLKFIKQGKLQTKAEKDMIFMTFSFVSQIRNSIKEFTLNTERLNTQQVEESGLKCVVTS